LFWLALAAGVVRESSAATLRVDVGGASQQVLAGFEPLTITHYMASPATGSYSSTLANGPGGQVTVQLSTSSIIGLAGQAGVNHPIGDLLEELAYIDSQLILTLKNLKAGTYCFRSYHHDPAVDRGNVDIFSTDAAAANVQRYDELVQTIGLTPGIVGTAPMVLKANGTSDVSVRITRTGTLRAALNGFEITDSLPSDLKIDVGLNGPGNDVQAGFQSLPLANDGGGASGDVSAPQGHWFFTELGNQGSVEVRLSTAASSPRIGVRDRGDVSGPLGDLLEDSVYNAQSRQLTLTLGSLLPGTYRLAGYFNDKGYDHGRVNILASDALGANRSLVAGASQTYASDSSLVKPLCSQIVSNGRDPVVVTFESPDDGSDPYVQFNGFELAADPILRVDFGQTPGTGRDDLQFGFQPFNAASSDAAFADGVYRDYASPIGADGTVRVRVEGSGDTLMVRDRGDVVGPLGDVAEDFIFNGGALDLVLEGLAAGTYAVTSYHHDATLSQATFDVLVTDALGTLRPAASGMSHTTGSLGAPALATFLATSDGAGDVLIRYNKLSGNGIALNGFSVALLVPEPASMVLLALGGVVAVAVARRRKDCGLRTQP
jgi:hypothetical protein